MAQLMKLSPLKWDQQWKHEPKSLYFVGLLGTKAKDIVVRFIIDYSSLRDFGP